MTTATLAPQLNYAIANGLMPYFRESSLKYNVPIDVLLAVASRESGIGTSRQLVNWVGDNGNGWGIMQIDRRAHPAFTASTMPNNHRAVIDYGAKYLSDQIRRFGYIQDAAAAYNAGPARVQTAINAGLDPDSVTTGRDYGRDVMARADLFLQLLNGNNALAYEATITRDQPGQDTVSNGDDSTSWLLLLGGIALVAGFVRMRQ